MHPTTQTPSRRSRKLAASILFALFLTTAAAFAEGGPQVYRGAESVGDPVTPYVTYVDLRDLPRAPAWEPGDPIVVNPRRWLEDVPGIENQLQRDPLVDRQRQVPEGILDFTQVADFAGLDSSAVPPDPTGDVGPNYVIQAINGGGTTFAVFNKDGTIAAGPMTLDNLGTGGCASGLGDPIVLYDQLADRWVLTEFSGATNALCVYVSLTNDPISGGWCNYQFNTSNFPDYPKYSVWPDAYYVTSNEGGGVPVRALDRENMLTCSTARPFQKLTAPRLPGLGFQAFTPADVDGAAPPPMGTPAPMMRHRDDELHDPGSNDPTTDILELWEFSVDWDNSANSTFTGPFDVVTSEFDSNLCPPLNVFSCIPQPGTGTRLDPLLEVIMNRLAYRNFGSHETLLGVLQTDVGDFQDHSGERWFELRRAATEGSGWALHQEGTYSPDSEHRFMGTVSMDGDGNVLLAYNVSSTSVFPSIRYTGRLASDPMGVMTQDEQTLVAGGGSNNFNRYGDYSQMGVDPADDCTFWFTAEYNPTSSSDTRIGAVRFNGCTGGAIFTDGFESEDTSNWSVTEPPIP